MEALKNAKHNPNLSADEKFAIEQKLDLLANLAAQDAPPPQSPPSENKGPNNHTPSQYRAASMSSAYLPVHQLQIKLEHLKITQLNNNKNALGINDHSQESVQDLLNLISEFEKIGFKVKKSQEPGKDNRMNYFFGIAFSPEYNGNKNPLTMTENDINQALKAEGKHPSSAVSNHRKFPNISSVVLCPGANKEEMEKFSNSHEQNWVDELHSNNLSAQRLNEEKELSR